MSGLAQAHARGQINYAYQLLDCWASDKWGAPKKLLEGHLKKIVSVSNQGLIFQEGRLFSHNACRIC